MGSTFNLIFVAFLCIWVIALGARPPLKLTLCKPRSLVVRFRAVSTPKVWLYRACDYKTGPNSSASTNCGFFENTLKVKCTEKACPPGSKCNTCSFRVNQQQVPRFYHNLNGTEPELGRYLVQIVGEELCSYGFVLEFTSDFADSGDEWFERNGFTTGCEDRVTCYSWNPTCLKVRDPPYDLTVFAQGCNTRLYVRKSTTARSPFRCFTGKYDRAYVPDDRINCPQRIL